MENRKRKNEDKDTEESLNMGSGIRRKVEIDESFEKELQAERGITILKTNAEKKMTEKRLIVVLENANLELGTLFWNKTVVQMGRDRKLKVRKKVNNMGRAWQ